MSARTAPRGLPGGIALPGALFVFFAAVFVICYRDPELVDLGPHISPSGVGVLGASATFMWLLFAIAKRPSPEAHVARGDDSERTETGDAETDEP